MAFIKSVCPFYILCIVNLLTIVGDRGSCGNLISKSRFIQHLLTPHPDEHLNIKFEGKLVWVEAGLTAVSDLLLPASSERAKLIMHSLVSSTDIRKFRPLTKLLGEKL